jgi:DNA-binding transcriptional LysR family regulator
MKMSLDEMATFVEVVDFGSFSAASEHSGVPISTISRRISDLEKRLNVQLLHRTTRRQNLTDIGAVYYEHCSRMLNEAKSAELAVQSLQAEPSGVLRIVTPYSLDDPFGSELFLSFIKKHDKVSIEFFAHTRKVDLIEEEVDCAVIPGELGDSSLIARNIGSYRVVHCVSPAYAQRFGIPEQGMDLSSHHVIRFQFPSWLNVTRSPITQLAPSRFTTNDFIAARRAALDGVGIGEIPEVQIRRHLDSGELIRVLPELDYSVTLNLVFPSNKKFTTKLRAFIDHTIDFAKLHAPWQME